TTAAKGDGLKITGLPAARYASSAPCARCNGKLNGPTTLAGPRAAVRTHAGCGPPAISRGARCCRASSKVRSNFASTAPASRRADDGRFDGRGRDLGQLHGKVAGTAIAPACGDLVHGLENAEPQRTQKKNELRRMRLSVPFAPLRLCVENSAAINFTPGGEGI